MTEGGHLAALTFLGALAGGAMSPAVWVVWRFHLRPIYRRLARVEKVLGIPSEPDGPFSFAVEDRDR